MYAVDQTVIAHRVHVHAPNTPAWDRAAASVYVTVAVTIRNETDQVLSHTLGALRDGDAAATWNFATRQGALRAVRTGQCVPVLRRVHALMQAGLTTQAHLAACELPSLGYVKAAFLLQCLYGALGCFDSRNAKQFAIDVDAVTSGAFGARAKTCERLDAQTQASRNYARLCDAHGGSAALWDNWCAGVSAQFPTRFPTADACSAEHVRWVDTVHAALWRDAGDIARLHIAYPDTQARMDALPSLEEQRAKAEKDAAKKAIKDADKAAKKAAKAASASA